MGLNGDDLKGVVVLLFLESWTIRIEPEPAGGGSMAWVQHLGSPAMGVLNVRVVHSEAHLTLRFVPLHTFNSHFPTGYPSRGYLSPVRLPSRLHEQFVHS